jgi:rhamnosyltransferase
MSSLYPATIMIPTLNAEKYLMTMLSALKRLVPSSQIIIIDSSSTDKTVEIARDFGIRSYVIQRDEFNHGKTRNLCIELCDEEFVIFMTQDALPYNTDFLAYLLEPFKDKSVAATYARQIPRPEAKTLEKMDRFIKYPDSDIIQSKEAIGELGSRVYFLSNSCAAYRMSTFIELGGFPEHEIMGEDAIFAHKAISKGYKIVYASKSEIYHSHDYTFIELFKRYFDTGVYRTKTLDIKEVQGKRDINQGSTYAKSIMIELIKTRQLIIIPLFFRNLFFSFLGYFIGKKYYLLPASLCAKLSMHSHYWVDK